MFGSIFADADVGPVTGMAGANADLAFGPASSDSPSGSGHPLIPTAANGFAWGFWLGVAGLAVLIFVRHSLPA